jgi:hypothetical protein
MMEGLRRERTDGGGLSEPRVGAVAWVVARQSGSVPCDS